MGATTRVRKRFERLWREVARPIGMGWWDVNFIYSTDEKEFDSGDQCTVLMRCTADWRYGLAVINVNVNYIDELSDELLERYFIHEMMHILVNEMRQKEDCLAHEERVVTGLTKAFEWSLDNPRRKHGT